MMGVTGSGKTTVGELLAQELGWKFYDADNFHPAENVEKMRQGIPLTDQDRVPWLGALANLIITSHKKEAGSSGANIVLACSALRESYRKMLARDQVPLQFVFLCGGEQLIKSRLEARTGHYMNPALLPSQFKTLEEPADALYVDVSPEPADIVRYIRKELNL